jgi:hypothetical protein
VSAHGHRWLHCMSPGSPVHGSFHYASTTFYEICNSLESPQLPKHSIGDLKLSVLV